MYHGFLVKKIQMILLWTIQWAKKINSTSKAICFQAATISTRTQDLIAWSFNRRASFLRRYLQGLGQGRVSEYLSTFGCIAVDQQVSSQFLPGTFQSSNPVRPVVSCHLSHRKPRLCKLLCPPEHLLQGQLWKQEEEALTYYLTGNLREQEVWLIVFEVKSVEARPLRMLDLFVIFQKHVF